MSVKYDRLYHGVKGALETLRAQGDMERDERSDELVEYYRKASEIIARAYQEMNGAMMELVYSDVRHSAKKMIFENDSMDSEEEE